MLGKLWPAVPLESSLLISIHESKSISCGKYYFTLFPLKEVQVTWNKHISNRILCGRITKTHIVYFGVQMERNLSSQRSLFACEMHSIPLFGSYRNYTLAQWPWFVAADKAALFSEGHFCSLLNLTQHVWNQWPNILNKIFFIVRSTQPSNIFSGLAFATPAVTTTSECVQTLLCLLGATEWQDHGQPERVSRLHYISPDKKSLAQHKVEVKDWHSAAVIQGSVLFV